MHLCSSGMSDLLCVRGPCIHCIQGLEQGGVTRELRAEPMPCMALHHFVLHAA